MNSKKYDLAVAYRIYPGVSKSPAIFPDDKYKLSELCIRSFRESLGKLYVKMWVLLDKCPPEYEQLFRKYFNDDDLEFIHLDGIGNNGTFKLQVETLLNQNESDYVYFAEDDYFYLPGAFEELYNFFHDTNADFATPYDHLDLYTMKLHDYRSKIRTHGSRHWRNVSSTCMTFLTHKKALEKTRRIFLSYSRRNDDLSLWMSLTKIKIFNPFVYLKYMFRGDRIFRALLKAWYFGWRQILFGKKYKLWSPMPTVGTHMEGISLSPGIKWDDKFRKYL
jgi:hypothetical protein